MVCFVGSFIRPKLSILIKLVKLFLTGNKITITVFTHCLVTKKSNFSFGHGLGEIVAVDVKKAVVLVREDVPLDIIEKLAMSCLVVH